MEPNTDTQEVHFGVLDMSKFDEQQIKEAFKKKNFPTVEVLKRPKA